MEKKECPLKLIFDILKKQLLSIFGKPNEGIHSYRICDIAYIDVIFTIIGAYLIKRYFYPRVSYLKILLILFLIGIIFLKLIK